MTDRRDPDLVLPTAFSLAPRVKDLARRPVLQFAILGAAIFAIAHHGESSKRSERRIDIASASLTTFEQAQAARDNTRALSPDRTREVEARAIEDEVLAREARRLGLDRDDPIVRQRMIQKLLLLVEDMGGASRPPTDAELRAYFDAKTARFSVPGRVHFVHVFASTKDALPPLESLSIAEGAPQPPPLGEAFPYSRDVTASREELSRVYGDAFAQSLFEDRYGWSDPIHSTFGWHRVHVVKHEGPRVPAFEEIRASLLLDYALDKRGAVVGDYLTKTIADYRIMVDGKPLTGFTPTHRIAARTDSSAED